MSTQTGKVIRLNFPEVPTIKEWLFSGKCFASAMLAVYISLKIGLTHPFWAVGTCYVIASPLAGAVRSKGLYRSIGTVIAGLMVVITIPLFANYRPIYVVVFGLFAGGCMYISMLDRTPRAYIFLISGFTAALVGTPMLADTRSMTAALPFDTAAARVLEITIALWCSALVHGIFFPQSIGDALLLRLDQIMHVARQWTANVLTGVKDSQTTSPYRQLALGITELRMMATHLPFDNHNIRWAAGIVRVLHDRLALLVPLVSGIENRLETLRKDSTEVCSADWRALLSEIAQWCLRGLPAPSRARQLHNRVRMLADETEAGTEWGDLLRVNFAAELHILLDTLEACFHYRSRIELGIRKGALQEIKEKDLPPVSDRALYADKGQAFLAAAGVFLSTVAGMTLWIVTDWPTGFQVAAFASIMSSIFAAMDNPVPALKMAFWYTFYSVPVAMFYLLVGIPSAHTMEMLVLMLAPFFLICGIYLYRPATVARSLTHLMSVVGMLMLYDFGQQDLESYLNGQGGQLIGIAIALGVTRLIRTAGAQRVARRIMRTGWQEMAQAAAAMVPVSLVTLVARMTDRVSLLAPRLAQEQSKVASSPDLMEDVRISVNMAYLLNMQSFLRDNGIAPDAFLKQLAVHFMDRLRQATQDGNALLAQLDRLLYQVCALPPSQEKNAAVSALAGIRQDIFPEALFLRAPAFKREVE